MKNRLYISSVGEFHRELENQLSAIDGGRVKRREMVYEYSGIKECITIIEGVSVSRDNGYLRIRVIGGRSTIRIEVKNYYMAILQPHNNIFWVDREICHRCLRRVNTFKTRFNRKERRHMPYRLCPCNHSWPADGHGAESSS